MDVSLVSSTSGFTQMRQPAENEPLDVGHRAKSMEINPGKVPLASALARFSP